MTPTRPAVYAAGQRLFARQVLTDFVTEQAKQIAGRVGFGWCASLDAPSTFDAIAAAYEVSRRTGDPLPVSSQHNDNIIYLDAAANQAFRFWHDVNHVERQLTFELVDELELALWHLTRLEHEGSAGRPFPTECCTPMSSVRRNSWRWSGAFRPTKRGSWPVASAPGMTSGYWPRPDERRE